MIAGKGFEVRRYDPLEAPEPEEWLALDEAERIRLAERYHRRAHIRVPNIKAHATIHVVVENQIALGDEIPVRATLDRLMGEGLDRHEAILRAGEPETHRIESYYAALERLTADIGAARADRAVAASSQRPATPLVSKSIAFTGFLRYCQDRKKCEYRTSFGGKTAAPHARFLYLCSLPQRPIGLPQGSP